MKMNGAEASYAKKIIMKQVEVNFMMCLKMKEQSRTKYTFLESLHYIRMSFRDRGDPFARSQVSLAFSNLQKLWLLK